MTAFSGKEQMETPVPLCCGSWWGLGKLIKVDNQDHTFPHRTLRLISSYCLQLQVPLVWNHLSPEEQPWMRSPTAQTAPGSSLSSVTRGLRQGRHPTATTTVQS